MKFTDPVFKAFNDFDLDDMPAQADISRRIFRRLEDIEIRAGAGIFHPVEPDAASAPTIGMHGVDVSRPNNFRRHQHDQGPGPRGWVAAP